MQFVLLSQRILRTQTASITQPDGISQSITPFPALAFEGIDQHEQSFHVLALRQTLTWDESGQLDYADEQAPAAGRMIFRRTKPE